MSEINLKIADEALKKMTEVAADLSVCLSRIHDMHSPAFDTTTGEPDRVWCVACGHPFPCPTVAVIRRRRHHYVP